MYDRDTNQKNRMPGRGQQITGWMLERLRALILNTVKSGPGVNVTRVGESVIVSLAQGGTGGGRGGGGGGTWMIYADTFAELPTPTVVNQFARITTGSDKGMTCVVNEDADGWVSFTHFM